MLACKEQYTRCLHVGPGKVTETFAPPRCCLASIKVRCPAVLLCNTLQVWGSGAKTEVIMQLLGLGHCRDTIVGDGGLMLRGISGGERKRLTTAEMVVGPQRVLLMDEISTGLDSATLHSVITFFTSVSTRVLQVAQSQHAKGNYLRLEESQKTLLDTVWFSAPNC